MKTRYHTHVVGTFYPPGELIALLFTAPSELARMYPTPPSLENNPALSPMTSSEAPQDLHVVIEGIQISSIKKEIDVGSTFADELLKVCVYESSLNIGMDFFCHVN